MYWQGGQTSRKTVRLAFLLSPQLSYRLVHSLQLSPWCVVYVNKVTDVKLFVVETSHESSLFLLR